MTPRRILAAFLVTLFIAASMAPLAAASRGPSVNGDVAINGAFRDLTPVGHPQKFYCDPYAPEGERPEELPDELRDGCARANAFVAYDWTTAKEMVEKVTVDASGARLNGSAFLQQHFAGTDAPDRAMQFFAVEITARSLKTTASSLSVELRTNQDPTRPGTEDFRQSVSFGASSTTRRLEASNFSGLQTGEIPIRALRLWASANADLVVERVSFYATNGLVAKNIHLRPAGDDVATTLGQALLVSPGQDGKFSFFVGMADDAGEFLATQDAGLCLYTVEQAMTDAGFPENGGGKECQDAILAHRLDGADDAAITKSLDRSGAFRFDVSAAAVQTKIASSAYPAFVVYGNVMADASYNEAASQQTRFRSGYLTAAHLAADAANAGVSRERYVPTPVFLDADANGIPDGAQTQETDGHSVIITPRLATPGPAFTVVAPDVAGRFEFEVQVYKYEGLTGAPMRMAGGIAFGLFDAKTAIDGGSVAQKDFFLAESRHLSRIDNETWLVSIPAAELAGRTAVGAWAFHDVAYGTPPGFWGRSSTDFYSALRNSVKEFAVADAMRSAMTPILLDASGVSAQPTLVIRMDPEADELTPVDGALVVGDGGDGQVTFRYAMVLPNGAAQVPSRGHGLALYDAAGVMSDQLQPGSRQLKHAEFFGVGTHEGNGWFRLDVPVSAFTEARGPVGAWAYADHQPAGGSLISRSGYYNLLKPAVASVSTSAAEATLYAPTPIVVLDEVLGIPKTAASLIAGLGTALASPTNPLVNPGFEANLFVEGERETRDNTGATMTSPPWFFRLDDRGVGAPTTPRSVHEVAPGKGRLGDNALAVNYRYADYGKGLMLGQLLGQENATAALLWQGASSVAFDVKTTDLRVLTFAVGVRYMAADGTIQFASGTVQVQPGSGWQRPSLAVNVPADGTLLGLYIQPAAAGDTRFFLDNVVIGGAKTTFGDARSDLADGFAVVIEPLHLTGSVQSRVTGANGQYYLYNVTVIDYTQGAAREFPTAAVARAFGLRTDQLAKDVGVPLTLRNSTTTFTAAIPQALAPATPAAPWAWVRAGEVYTPFDSGVAAQPASGYYSPLKNSLRTSPLADQLDYAGTPVVFGPTSAQTLAAQQTLRLAPVSGGHQVFVAAESPFVEQTTLTVSVPGETPRTYPVTLARDIGDAVPGLVLTPAEQLTATITTGSTLFTKGATLIPGSPVVDLEICRPLIEGCVSTGILSRESLTFRSLSTSPTNETLTYVWNFGNGVVTTTSATEIQQAYAAPGVYEGNLTVTTPSGKKSTMAFEVVVHNRAPTIAGVDVLPTDVYVDTPVTLRARAGDVDGGSLSYAWTFEGVGVPGETRSTLGLSPSVLSATIGRNSLEKRTYEFAVQVYDGQGGMAESIGVFDVKDRPTLVGAPTVGVADLPGATYALPGETLAVSVPASDSDSTIERVDLEVTTATGTTTVPLALAGGAWTGTVTAGAVGDMDLRAVAFVVGQTVGTPGASATFEVRADTAPVVSIAGPLNVTLGDNATYTVTSSDPDGRGAVTVGLVVADATLVGNATGPSGQAFQVSFGTMGFASVRGTAVDASGATSDVELFVTVDDRIFVALEMVRAPQSPTEGYLVRVRVTDVLGQPLAGVRVLVEDFYEPFPAALRTQTVTTGADGSRLFRVDPEASLVGLPLGHRLVASASAPSHADAPNQDLESASATLRFSNTGFQGLPLP